MSHRTAETKGYARPTEDMMTARSPSERFCVTLVCVQSVHRSTHAGWYLPFTDDARVGTQSTQHVALAFFDKLNFLAECSFVGPFAEPSDDPLTWMHAIVSHSVRRR